jgi:DNA polymerase-3 subunit gamma/tau
VHLALARKYRPRAFADLIGQEHVARALRGAVAQGRAAHGYLLCGPRGVGKTTAARILAMALNCETRARGGATPAPGEPCGECPSCERIWSGGASLDVVEIDAASNRGVDDARDLRERAMYAASAEGRYKIYIVDEAHMLTREAWNALLKILEEPPPRVIFVFATTEPQRITNTAAPVMSRLQRFDFRRVGPHAIAERLAQVAAAEHLPVESDACDLIARVADGGMRDALSVLDQVTAFGEGPVTTARVRDLLGLVSDDVYVELLDLVAGRRADGIFPYVATLVEAGVDLVAFADGLGDLWRAVLAVTLGGAPDGVSAALGAIVRERAGGIAPGDALRILRALAEAEEPIRRSGNPRLVLETLLVRWALLDRTVDIAELLKAEGTEAQGHGGTGGGAPAIRPERHAPIPSAPAAPRPSARPVTRTLEDSGALPAAVPGPSAIGPSRDGPPAPVPGGEPLSGLFTVEALRARWSDVVTAARAEKPVLASILEDTEPESLGGGALVLRVLGRSTMTAEGLSRSRARLEELLSRLLGGPVRVGTQSAVAGPARPAAAERPAAPERVTADGARAERTRALRAKHPALDQAVDALDLELLE